jgi:hypothetical protein
MKFYIIDYFASSSFLSPNILVSTLFSLTVLFRGLKGWVVSQGAEFREAPNRPLIAGGGKLFN